MVDNFLVPNFRSNRFLHQFVSFTNSFPSPENSYMVPNLKTGTKFPYLFETLIWSTIFWYQIWWASVSFTNSFPSPESFVLLPLPKTPPKFSVPVTDPLRPLPFYPLLLSYPTHPFNQLPFRKPSLLPLGTPYYTSLQTTSFLKTIFRNSVIINYIEKSSSPYYLWDFSNY